MVKTHSGVVFVDSDDLLLPERVARAREQLARADAVACALDLVDEAARPLGLQMPVQAPLQLEERMPVVNIFGLSNTAYSSVLLAHCLPVPPGCVLVDWYLATRAVLAGGRLAFDATAGMQYRQHSGGTAQPMQPSQANLHREARLVLQHLDLVLQGGMSAGEPRRGAWERRRDEVATFSRMLEYPARAEAYVRALNEIELEGYWWETVAHPRLEAIWRW